MEEGGAFRRKEEPQPGQSEWLPDNGGGNGAAGSPEADGGEAKGDPKPADAKGSQPDEAKGEAAQSESKAEAQSGTGEKPDADAKDEEPAKAKAADRNRQRDEKARMPSDVDALGQDKHRQVIGQHNPNRAKQILYYAIFIVCLVGAYLGLQAAVAHFDKAPSHDKASAPWAQPGAPQVPLGGFEPSQKGQKGPTHFQ